MEDFVSKYYTSDMWRVTYSRGIRPVQGMKLWPRMNRLPVLPPPYRLGNRGRPRNYDRKKGANESSSSSTKLGREKRMMTCSNCLDTGHNKTTCPNPTAEREPKRPRGRPRLQDVVCFLFVNHLFSREHVVYVAYTCVFCRGNQHKVFHKNNLKLNQFFFFYYVMVQTISFVMLRLKPSLFLCYG